MNKTKSVGMEKEDYSSTCRKTVIGFHKTYSRGLDNSHYTKDPMEG